MQAAPWASVFGYRSVWNKGWKWYQHFWLRTSVSFLPHQSSYTGGFYARLLPTVTFTEVLDLSTFLKCLSLIPLKTIWPLRTMSVLFSSFQSGLVSFTLPKVFSCCLISVTPEDQLGLSCLLCYSHKREVDLQIDHRSRRRPPPGSGSRLMGLVMLHCCL